MHDGEEEGRRDEETRGGQTRAERHEGGGKRSVRRTAGGQFKESDQVSKSLPSDRRTKAKTKAKKGQGDRWDQ
jgi:hypothetical protein